MYHSSGTNFFSIHANVCAQKSWKITCPGFDPVTPVLSNKDKQTLLMKTRSSKMLLSKRDQ